MKYISRTEVIGSAIAVLTSFTCFGALLAAHHWLAAGIVFGVGLLSLGWHDTIGAHRIDAFAVLREREGFRKAFSELT